MAAVGDGGGRWWWEILGEGGRNADGIERRDGKR